MEHEEYLKALRIVMRDDSKASQQNAQYIEWAYQSLLEAFLDGGGTFSEDTLNKKIPYRLFKLAVSVDWIPYLDDQAYSLPDKLGDINISGWLVSQEIWDAFMLLLPVEDFDDFINVRWAPKSKDWKQPTPKELILDFIGTKRRPSLAWLARQMHETPGYAHSEYAAIQFLKLRLKEPKGSQVPKFPGLRQAEVLVSIFKKEEPAKHADLRPQQFFWDRA